MIGLVLSLALAFADPLSGFRQTRGPVKTIDFSTFAPGCYAPTAIGFDSLTQNAGKVTECWDGSTFQICAVNQMCITTADDGLVGLRVEGNHSNLILNATTHPKAAETTGVPVSQAANQDCYIWARGSGTITATVTAGSVPSDPENCMGRAIPAGTPIRGEACRFRIGTTATRFAITTDATVTAAQIECRGATQANVFGPTALVTTAATAVSRGEALRAMTDLIGTTVNGGFTYCVKALVAPSGRLGGAIIAGGGAVTPVGSMGAIGSLNGTTGNVLVRYGTGTPPSAAWTVTAWPTVTAGARHLVTVSTANAARAASLVVDAVPIPLTLPAAAAAIQSYTSTSLDGNIGTGPYTGAAAAFDGIISKVQVFWGPCQ